MPLRCDICHINVPNPWTIMNDMFLSCFNDKYREKYGGRKYPGWYNSVIIIGDDDITTWKTGRACIAHYYDVRKKLEQEYKKARSNAMAKAILEFPEIPESCPLKLVEGKEVEP